MLPLSLNSPYFALLKNLHNVMARNGYSEQNVYTPYKLQDTANIHLYKF